MRLKIVSDGTLLGTNLVNAETGERVKNVGYIEWRADARYYGDPTKFATAFVRLFGVEVDLEVPAGNTIYNLDIIRQNESDDENGRTVG